MINMKGRALLLAGADAATPGQSETDFRFSNLKRKWHAEEGKYLSIELRRSQDLNVQQEMELEALRQQLASLTSAAPQVDHRLPPLEFCWSVRYRLRFFPASAAVLWCQHVEPCGLGV